MKQRFDTIKIMLPPEGWNDINLSHPKADRNRKQAQYFEDNLPTGQYYTKSDNTQILNPDHGFNELKYDHLSEKVILKTSAKIFKNENYYEGLNPDTFDEYTHNINESGLISLDPDKVLKYAEVNVVDVTNNFEVRNRRESASSVIQCCMLSQHYDVIKYKGGGFSSTRKVKSYKERMIGYHKPDEFKLKSNKDFVRFYPDALKGFTNNTQRFESNFVQLERIRRNFRTTNTKLSTLFNATANPNQVVFERMIEEGVQIDLFSDAIRGKTLKSVLEEKGAEKICHLFQYDKRKIRAWIRENWARSSHNDYYKRMDYWLSILQPIKPEVVNKNIEEIRRLFKQAS